MVEKCSPEVLRAALEEAHLPTLLAAMTHLSGDDSWLREEWRPAAQRGTEEDNSGGLRNDVQAAIRSRALDTVLAAQAGDLDEVQPPSADRILEILALTQGPGTTIPAGFAPCLAEELGVASRDVPIPQSAARDSFHVVVIGSGFGGLCAAIKLKHAGIRFTIVEKNEDVGGTWWENTYPGCGVDSPGHLYSFSFAQRADWTRYFAKRNEVHRYLAGLADEHGILPAVRFGTEVIAAEWMEERATWQVTVRTSDGSEESIEANAIISAVGYLNRPVYPQIEGLETFAGPSMHTARWDADIEMRDKRVSVIGTGASAMQLVPSIAGTAEKVTVFQRSAQWAVPNGNYPRDVSAATQTLMTQVPHYLGWYRLRLAWNFGDKLHGVMQIDPDWPHPERSISAVNDRHRQFLTGYIASELGERSDLLEKCVPNYPPYGKRPLIDNGWFRTIVRDDVELITDGIDLITPTGVVLDDGREIPTDVLVIATGFKNLDPLGHVEVRGRSGLTLRDSWGENDGRAYLGMSVPDYPNFFFLLGPNTVAGHGGSAAMSIELQVRYIMKLFGQMLANDIASVECRQDVHDAYDAKLSDALDRTIWASPNLNTYYRNAKGRIVTPMPWTNEDYWQMTVEPDLADFHTAVTTATSG